MLSSAEKEEFKNRAESAFVSLLSAESRISDERTRRARRSSGSDRIREKKVEEAKRKKRSGEYNSEEVYRRIADKLIDLFGI